MVSDLSEGWGSKKKKQMACVFGWDGAGEDLISDNQLPLLGPQCFPEYN